MHDGPPGGIRGRVDNAFRDSGRHAVTPEPARNVHHGGSAGDAEDRSNTRSRAVTFVSGCTSSNEQNRRSTASFSSHANVLFPTPPSPKQWSQRRFTPGGVSPTGRAGAAEI